MFYDLNLGVDGVGDQVRREMVAMAMRLGYSGIAANHIFTGVMADSDRCKLRPFELPTLLAAAPGVAEAAKFHQKVLGVPPGLPFRQFTRITVVVDNPSQANTLNSGNPVLKTYDLVAVRPTNQKSFNQACSHIEADLISLDVSQKLPFRLKMPMVKVAIERGLYFEVCYGPTILDPKARRELFANTQMLQTAARGRNIIVSSGARRALEMRGPNDAANMCTLFGMTLESANAAVSRNCKAVLLHGVMRKATYRGAIHIDRVFPAKALDSDNVFSVPTDWDPLSLGGASADLIPTEGTSEVPSTKDSPPENDKSVKGGDPDSNRVKGGTTEFITLGLTGSKDSRAVSEVGTQQEKVDKSRRDWKPEVSKLTSEQNHLAESARGLIISIAPSSVEVHESSASIRKQNERSHAFNSLQKEAIEGNKHKRLEPSMEKLGQKRKRKKRKR